MRVAHFLKHNVKAESPQACIFFDTETNSMEISPGKMRQDLKLGVACFIRRRRLGKWSAGEWHEFTDEADFWTWVYSKTLARTKLWIFAHNLVFDMAVVKGFTSLQANGYKLTKAIVDDPPTVLQYRLGHCSICLVDTFNYFRSSLEELGQSIGLPKLAMPRPDDSSESWSGYCKRDTEILKEAMLSYMSFIKKNDLGNFQLTIASQAFTAYRHRFMKAPVFIDNDSKALELSRKGYHGGRCEAFFIGELTGDFYLVDVNSMYPFVMSVNEYPIRHVGSFGRVSVSDLIPITSGRCVVADVTLETDENVYPLRNKEGLVFPLGNFRTVLTTPSLEYALAHNHVKKVHFISVYKKEAVFQSYVDALYSLRMKYKTEGNQAFEYLCKLMLNSLYGKFGQSGRVFEDTKQIESDEIKSWVEYDADTKETTSYRQFGGLVQAFKNEGESFNSLPVISAHVCDYARMWLWKLMETAGKENVYYVDTDSLVVNDRGFANLSLVFSGEGLGELKLVKQFKHLIIHGAKDYVFDDMVKIKGIRKMAILLASNVYEQDKFSHFKSMVKAGNLDTVTVHKETKHLKRFYRKGYVLPSGRIEPFTIDGEGFDFLLAVFKRKAGTELLNQKLMIGEGVKFNEWLASEIRTMEIDLNARTIPYGGGFVYGRDRQVGYYAGWLTKELDARWIVFKEYLSSQSSGVQSQP